jgi:hypothetical protein
MIKPPEFSEIIQQPLSEADKHSFLADQLFLRDLEWRLKNFDLFSEVK